MFLVSNAGSGPLLVIVLRLKVDEGDPHLSMLKHRGVCSTSIAAALPAFLSAGFRTFINVASVAGINVHRRLQSTLVPNSRTAPISEGLRKRLAARFSSRGLGP